MQRQEENNNNGFDVIVLVIAAILMTALVMMCSGCKQTEYIPVIEHKTDTMYISKVQRDSIYLHDSTFIQLKGDTIFFEKWHTKYIEKLTHDTTYVATHDTIPQPYEVVKIEKERYTPWIIKLLAWLGGAGLLTLIIYIIAKIRRLT